MTTKFFIGTKIGKACSKESTRYAINNPWVSKTHDDQGVFLTATNGRAAAIVHTTGETDGTKLLPTEILPTAKKGATITLNEDRWETDNGKFAPAIADPPNTPNIVDVLPDVDGRILLNLNAKLLYELAESIGCTGVISLLIEPPKEGQPVNKAVAIVAHGHDTPEAIGAIMPARGGDNFDPRDEYTKLARKYRESV